jgi:hypothetical protein
MGNNTSKNMWPSFKHPNNDDEESLKIMFTETPRNKILC